MGVPRKSDEDRKQMGVPRKSDEDRKKLTSTGKLPPY